MLAGKLIITSALRRHSHPRIILPALECLTGLALGLGVRIPHSSTPALQEDAESSTIL